MTRIGLISDTHGYFDPRLRELLSDADEIWHAGDIGDIRVLDELRAFKPLRAVYGNIDDKYMRCEVPETLRFWCEGVDLLLTHIGGYPGKYAPKVLDVMKTNAPQLFVAGHSHILKVIYDNKYNALHLNPGACGRYGFHAVRTALRFVIDGTDIRDMEILELGRRG